MSDLRKACEVQDLTYTCAIEPPLSTSHELPTALWCEACGYVLFGLTRGGACPECGQPIEASLPHHRTGPPWQNRLGFRAWAATAAGVLVKPRRTFRAMRLDGNNGPARLFLLSMATIVGVGWGCFSGLGLGQGFLTAWLLGMVAAKVVLVLTYIETLGVTLFSRRRGWRVSVGLAERVTGYASVGWGVAAVVLALLTGFYDRGLIQRAVVRWFGPWDESYVFLLAAVGFGGAVVFFEMLVWTGVRAVRYGNRPQPRKISG